MNFNLYCRWRIFRRPIIAIPSRVEKFTLAAVALHNYLRTEESSVYCPSGFIDAEDAVGNIIPGRWRDESMNGLQELQSVSGNRYSRLASDVRESFRQKES